MSHLRQSYEPCATSNVCLTSFPRGDGLTQTLHNSFTSSGPVWENTMELRTLSLLDGHAEHRLSSMRNNGGRVGGCFDVNVRNVVSCTGVTRL